MVLIKKLLIQLFIETEENWKHDADCARGSGVDFASGKLARWAVAHPDWIHASVICAMQASDQ